MNTEIIVHPKLQHYGLTTANLDAMIDWYRKVLGMTINYRSAAPAGAQNGPPFSAWHLSATMRSIIASYSLKCRASSPIPTNAATRGCSTSLSNTRHSTICWAPMLGSRA